MPTLERSAIEEQVVTKKLEAKSIHFQYGETEILKDINLEVNEGEFVVFMGPSGSGKSTFLRLLAGLSQPNSGNITINQKEINEVSPDCAVVFQDYSLFPWLTARENLVLALKQKFKKTKTKKELQELAEQYLSLVHLGHAVNKYPGEMSGGMRQRVAIARAFSIGADLLLMDEPFGALDPITRIHLQELILQISRNQNRTMVFVTHDVEEAIYLADRIVMFSPGPPGTIIEEFGVPFSKPRNRKKLFQSHDFIAFRDHLLAVMNQGVFDKLNLTAQVSNGEGI